MLYSPAYVLHVRHANVLRPKAGRESCRRCCARRINDDYASCKTRRHGADRVGIFFGVHAMPTVPIGILGATGMVGQQFIALLADHPWFRVAWLGASQRSEGKPYRDAAAWRLPAPLSEDVARLMVDQATPGRAPKLVFSGLDSSVAGEIEGAFAEAGHIIVSNSRNYRMETDVPLLIPEVNADHLALLQAQSARSWKGRIVTNPNCVVVVY